MELARKIQRGLILQQPWARLVAEGIFPVLVRPIPTHIRGRVAIVAKGVDPHALVDGTRPSPAEFPQLAIIGSVIVRECLRVPARSARTYLERIGGRDFAKFYPAHYLPKNSPAYLWILEHPRKRATPSKLPKRGARVWIKLDDTNAR